MALLLNIGGTRDSYLISYDFPWFKHNQLEQTIVVAYKAYSESASSNNSARLLTLGHYQSNSSEYLDLIQYWTSAGGTEVPSTRFNPLSNPSLPSGYNSGNDRLLAINSYYASSSLHLMATSVELDNDLQVMYTTDNKLRAYNRSELVNIAQHLTIGTLNENNILNRVWLGEIYYVAILNRPLQSTELQSIAAGDVMLLDDYRSNLYELWDFGKAERDEAFTGLISGTVMNAIGTAWSLTGESKYPVSRDTPSCIQGQLGTSIHDAPAWLSTLDSPAAGSETINCSPAALTTEGQAAGVLASEVLQTGSGTLSVGAASASIVELATIGCTATALSVGGEPCAIHQQQAINCTAADTAVSGQQASIVEAGQDTIACTAAAVSLAAAAAQQVEAGSSTINCTSGALSVTSPVAGMVEAGDSVIGCSTATLSIGAHAAVLVEVGSSIVNCTVGALSVTAPPAGIIEVGDSVIGCSTAALSLSSSQAAVVESGTSVIGCAAASLSISGTTASITDSMGVRTAAVVLDTPGCSIHDFDIIGASSTDLSIGSSVAGMVEVGEAVIGTGYADIGITTTPCALITTDAEPIITNIGLVASINQPSIFASIPNITITAKV